MTGVEQNANKSNFYIRLVHKICPFNTWHSKFLSQYVKRSTFLNIEIRAFACAKQNILGMFTQGIFLSLKRIVHPQQNSKATPLLYFVCGGFPCSFVCVLAPMNGDKPRTGYLISFSMEFSYKTDLHIPIKNDWTWFRGEIQTNFGVKYMWSQCPNYVSKIHHVNGAINVPP